MAKSLSECDRQIKYYTDEMNKAMKELRWWEDEQRAAMREQEQDNQKK